MTTTEVDTPTPVTLAASVDTYRAAKDEVALMLSTAQADEEAKASEIHNIDVELSRLQDMRRRAVEEHDRRKTHTENLRQRLDLTLRLVDNIERTRAGA